MLADACRCLRRRLSSNAPLPLSGLRSMFVDTLPGDKSTENAPRQVLGAAYSFVAPTEPPNPTCVAYSPTAASQIGLPVTAPVTACVQALSGGLVLPTWKPYAACYGGHQFGSWARQLGDGRAVTLGEALSTTGEGFLDVQLKGAGATPYSRFADGKAVMRSSLREFFGSEALHALGVPTVRAVSCVATGEQVLRDEFYSGHAKYEPGAVVCRTAPSFLRFGSLELPAANGDGQLMQDLCDHAVRHWFPEAAEAGTHTHALATFLMSVSSRTARLVAQWQALGFVHGVMNTDNMSLLGLTLDLGPYGFMEALSPFYVPNASDRDGRYSFGSQARMGLWNVSALASLFVDLVPQQQLQDAVAAFPDVYQREYAALMAAKLGLPGAPMPAREELLNSCFNLLESSEVDYTNFWFALASVDETSTHTALPPLLHKVLTDAGISKNDKEHSKMEAWVEQYKRVLQEAYPASDRLSRVAVQLRSSPRHIPRNFHMHAVCSRVETHLAAGAPEHAQDLTAAYLRAVTSPYFPGTAEEYLAHAEGLPFGAASTPSSTQTHTRAPWSPEVVDGCVSAAAMGQSVHLYPQAMRPGVSISSCSS